MALIVEDGTGIATANSYVSIDEAKAYFADLGEDRWYDSEPALINATQAVDLLYGRRYLGDKATAEQGLMFPRTAFEDNDGFARETGTVPAELKKAVFELALRNLIGEELIPDNTQDTLLKVHEIKLDVLEERKEFFAPKASTEVRKADLILKPILKQRAAGVRKLVRG